MSFGIALPSWIVEKENSVWVLGLYALVFMVALPTVVGMWWYRSIRYTGDQVNIIFRDISLSTGTARLISHIRLQVLLATTQMYYGVFSKTSSTALKRVIMILGASCEFSSRCNAEIVERQSDCEEVPSVINVSIIRSYCTFIDKTR